MTHTVLPIQRSAALQAATVAPHQVAERIAQMIPLLALQHPCAHAPAILDLLRSPADVIDHARRICYRADPREDPNDSVRAMVKRGHGAILEHAVLTLELVCERSLSHELVRHRLASYAQESQRYVAEENNLAIILPGDYPEGDALWSEARNAAAEAFASYRRQIDLGAKPELARNSLPNCAATRILMTANVREWRWVLCLRAHKAAHPDMRRLMVEAHRELSDWFPAAFEHIPEAHFEERVRALLAKHPEVAGDSLFDKIAGLLEAA